MIPGYLLAFVLGGLFVHSVSSTAKNNTQQAKENLEEVLYDRRELINKVNEILREKELNGEIEIRRKS